MVAALYRRYRPETFAEMIGQQQVTEPLMTALRTGRINHAYLFSGPRGCGKTSSARILARCLNCAEGPTPTPCGTCASCRELSRDGGGSLDVVEIDAASHGGVDDARELRERAMTAPARDRYKIFIIDEAHMVTSGGFNALLKVVEEPPEEVLFMFATTEPEKVIGTIRSRTHHYPFRLIPPATMLSYIGEICDSEGVAAEPGVLPLVVRAGGGSARDTLSLLDQLIAGTDGVQIPYDMASQLLGFTSQGLLDATIAAIASGDASEAYKSVDAVIQSGQDPRRFVEDLLERVRDLIVAKATGSGVGAVLRGRSEDDLAGLRDAAARFSPSRLSHIADVVNETLTEMSGVTAPRVQLELMIARILVGVRATFADAVASDAEAPVAAEPVASGAMTQREPASPDAREPLAPVEPARMPGRTAATPEPVGDPKAQATSAWAATAPGSAPSASSGEAAPGEAAPAEVDPSMIDFRRVSDVWPDVLNVVKRVGGRSAWAIAQQIVPISWEAGNLRVEFPNRGVFEQFKVSVGGRPSPGELFKSALKEVLGTTTTIYPRVRRGDAPAPTERPAPADDAERHRGPAAPPVTPTAPGAPPSVGWNVAPIPSGPAEDGPGSGWDELATGGAEAPVEAGATTSGAASASPDTRADATVTATSEPRPPASPPTAPDPDTTDSVAPLPEREAPEIIAAREAAALEAATTPEPMPEATVRVDDPAVAERIHNPTAPTMRGGDADHSTTASRHASGALAATATWTVAAVGPVAEPEPEPVKADEPEPEELDPYALPEGVERYGEAVIRERLGARFVSEEPIIASSYASGPEGDFGTPPDDDAPPPPEEY